MEERLADLADSMISAVSLTTTNLWVVKHFDRLAKEDDEELKNETRTCYVSTTTNHRVLTRLHFDKVEGKRSARISVDIRLNRERLLNEQANFVLNMYIVDKEHYRHAILRKHTISLRGDESPYYYEFVAPALETMTKLVWDDKSLHIASELEEVMHDSNAIVEEPRSPRQRVYKDPLVIREFDPQRTAPDVVFNLDDRKIFAHKRLVEPRSTYLDEAIKQDGIQQNNITYVDLTRQAPTIGLTPAFFDAIFDYMYGRKSIFELSEHAIELLILASNLGMEGLKNGLEYYINDTMNELNIVDVLLLFKKYDCQFLRTRAVIYAKSRLPIIAQSEHFAELCKDHMLMRELCGSRS